MKTNAVTSVQEAVAIAAGQAIKAKCQQTFSVGGTLLGPNGDVLLELHNNVVVGGVLQDPTAHGERQMIDLYYAMPEGERPPADQVVLVTSLDPCCMCTGAILTAGIKTVVSAFDTFAGINYEATAEFTPLPDELKVKAKQLLSYPEVNGDSCNRRAHQGAPVPGVFEGNDVIEEHTEALCDSVFAATLSTVQALINKDVEPSAFLDISLLEGQTGHLDYPIWQAVKANYSPAVSVRCENHRPDVSLAPLMRDAMQTDRGNGGPGNAVAFLDAFGNLISCSPGGDQSTVPTATAFMKCTQNYAALRASLSHLENARKYLQHPRYGTFVFARGPGESSLSFMDLGAYGSTMEGELPANNPNQFQYVVPTIPSEDLALLCGRMPPLYTLVIKVNPTQVVDAGLIAEIEQELGG